MVERDDKINDQENWKLVYQGKQKTRNIEEARIEVTDGEVELYVILEFPFFRSCFNQLVVMRGCDFALIFKRGFGGGKFRDFDLRNKRGIGVTIEPYGIDNNIAHEMKAHMRLQVS